MTRSSIDTLSSNRFFARERSLQDTHYLSDLGPLLSTTTESINDFFILRGAPVRSITQSMAASTLFVSALDNQSLLADPIMVQVRANKALTVSV